MEWGVVILLMIILNVNGSSLCGRKHRSCSNQIWGNDDVLSNSCQIVHYKSNSTECAALNFDYGTNFTHKVGDVRIRAYVDRESNWTSFNVTFSKIKWKKLRMRFTRIGLENDINTCRAFNIWENATVPKKSILTYDCPWSNLMYEGHDFALEYEFEAPIISYNRYIFKIPHSRSLETVVHVQSLEIFTYLDVTDTDYLYLYIQLAPPQYNITSYLVEVIRERSNISTRLTVQILNARDAINGQLFFPYPTWNEFGYFFFNVSPLSTMCEENVCLKSPTPKIFMGRRKSSLVIGIVGASVIIFALFYAMFFWNRQKNIKDDTPPRVLLVYNISINAHYNVVRSLARLLNDVLHIEIFLDVFDIPQTHHQNPVLWYNQAFRDATHVIYIASPEASPTAKPHSDNIYRIDSVTMKAIITKIACSTNTKQILVITFPYSTNAIPEELNNLRRFDLLKDIDSFVNSIVMLPYQSWTFLHIYRPNRFRGEPQYMELLDHIQHAQKEIDQMSNASKNEIPQITVVDQDAAAENEELLKIKDTSTCNNV
ncbi:hypothetical protein FQR65_LT05984 [Abscondita terminalis]|nr:hypothetical protein FQR65_LT05984 [Abscondita terminalis]